MTSATLPLVSVVTPVFNEESYLAECVDSVIAQSYERWELVIVDNRSTDRSAEIAAKYADRHPRITLHRNERHLPQVDNINRTLELVSPESTYCKPVLGDDRIFPDCLARMVEVAENAPTVGVVCSHIATETELIGVGLPTDRNVFGGPEVCARQLLEGTFYFGSPTAQLWRSEIVRDRKPFYRTDFHCDTDACYDLLESWEFGFVHDALTFRRTWNDSVTSRLAGLDAEFTDGLVMMTKYGRRYLDARSFDDLRGSMWRSYRRNLGESLLRRRSPHYWEHHASALREMGVELSPGFKLGCAAAWLADLAAHPVRTVGRLAGRATRRSTPRESRASSRRDGEPELRSRTPDGTEPTSTDHDGGAA